MLKTPMSKFCSNLSVRLRDIAEKQVPAKLNHITSVSGTLIRTIMNRYFLYRVLEKPLKPL